MDTLYNFSQDGYKCSSRCYVKASIARLNPIIAKDLSADDGDPLPFTRLQEKCEPFPVDAFPDLMM